VGIKLELAGKPVAAYRPRELVVALTTTKFIRYSIASLVAVTCGQIALWTLTLGLDWDGVPANLGSVAVGSVPNYLINRYWTWQQSGRNRLWTEIVPFWTMAFLGVVLSTFAVAYADDEWGTPLAIALAQLSGFGVLWFARFLILDKVMWRVVHDHLDADAEVPAPEQVDLGASSNGKDPAEAADKPTSTAKTP
jgi:putative flippase GtrA